MANEANARLDRIEDLLEKTSERILGVASVGLLHDDRLTRIENSMNCLEHSVEDLVSENKRHEQELDGRIGKLVSALGEFIRNQKS